MSLEICKADRPLNYLLNARLKLKNVHVSIANAIPRTMVRWVQTVSLNPVHVKHFLVTKCPITEPSEKVRVKIEQIAWRIPPDLLQPFDPDMGLNSSNCLKFVLKQSHTDMNADPRQSVPGMHPHDEELVTSSQIAWEPLDTVQESRVRDFYKLGQNTDYTSRDGRVCRPNFEDAILTVMRPGEHIDITFYLTLSNTELVDHYGGSPVTAHTVLLPIPQVKIVKPIRDVEDIENILNVCPRKVFQKKNSQLTVVNERACISCNLCQRLSTDPERIQLYDRDDEYDIQVVTREGMPLEDLMRRTFRHIQDNCSFYLESLANLV